MTDNTYTYPKKEDLEIIVGDEKQQDFKPRIKIKRWDNEVNFSVGVISAHAGTDQKPTDKVEWDDGHGTKARFYEKEGDEFEFEIELASKPASNILHLSIETKGLDFFYQPELTEEEKEIDPETGIPKHMRPENVVGSYAAYHSTATGNIVDGNNYRAGKFAHIYRPYATDSNGWRVWCDMHIDKDMKITIPQDFIYKAVYPIIVDPTFGCDPEIPGGSTYNTTEDRVVGPLFTSPSNIGTAQSISAYIRALAGTDLYIKGLIVLHSNLNIITNGIGSPSSLITSQSGIWGTSTFATNPEPANSTEYILMHLGDIYHVSFYDTGATDQGHVDYVNSYSSPQDLDSITHSTRRFSTYCTYEIAAGGANAPTSTILGPIIGPLGGPI